MKTLKLFAAASMLLSFTAKAQNKTEGCIYYNMTVNLHANLSKDQVAYKALLPEKITKNISLFFKDDNYKLEVEKDKKSGEMQVSISIADGSSTQIVCADKQTCYALYKKESKTYYTEDKLEQTSVTIDKKTTKKILGYTCYKATYKRKEQNFVLWITYDIPLTANPIDPTLVLAKGLVLEATSPKVSYRATKINFEVQGSKLFEIAGTYKKISKEQASDLE